MFHRSILYSIMIISIIIGLIIWFVVPLIFKDKFKGKKNKHKYKALQLTCQIIGIAIIVISVINHFLSFI